MQSAETEREPFLIPTVVYEHNIFTVALGKRFEPLLKPLFVCYTFEAKFHPSKLCCHIHFNVCTCTLVQSKCVVNNVGMFQKC